MSKTYTGIELLQAIKNGEIKRNTEFSTDNKTIMFFDGQILRHRNDYCGTPKNTEIGMSWLRGNFELLDDDINIQSIEELKEEDFLEYDESHLDWKEQLEIAHLNKMLKAIKQIDRQINNK